MTLFQRIKRYFTARHDAVDYDRVKQDACETERRAKELSDETLREIAAQHERLDRVDRLARIKYRQYDDRSTHRREYPDRGNGGHAPSSPT